MDKKTHQLRICGLKVSFDPCSPVFSLDTLFLQTIGWFKILQWPVEVLQRYGSCCSNHVHHSNQWLVVMEIYRFQCYHSYCFHFTFTIITISILCSHNHMHFELSSWEKHEHPPTMPLFAKVTGFCTSTFLTCSKGKLKQTLEEVIKLCKEVYLLHMSL